MSEVIETVTGGHVTGLEAVTGDHVEGLGTEAGARSVVMHRSARESGEECGMLTHLAMQLFRQAPQAHPFRIHLRQCSSNL